MFRNQHFYHQHVRKAIIAFGTLFNGIYVRRTDDAGDVTESLKVPLSYAPKQKFIDRIREVPEIDETRKGVAITLPRMGFEITTFNYDASRKLAITQNVRSVDTAGITNTGMRYSFVSTPYNMGISLSVFAKNQDDGLQIIEQILPYFNPDFNVTINTVPELGVKNDLQIILDSVDYQDEWEGSFDKRLSVIWNLNFTMKLNFFGYVRDANVIKTVIENIYAVKDIDAALANPEGLLKTTVTTTPDPSTATPLDDYSYLQEFDSDFS
jgi:hypothetical protein